MPVSVSVAEAPLTVFQKPQEQKYKKWKEPSKWAKHQFTCFDGEGMNIRGRHQYVYMCAYDGTDFFEIRNDDGLGSEECFAFMVDVASRHKYGINCIYGGTYDANMMLRDVNVKCLFDLQQTGTCRWNDWRLSLINRKEFTVTHIPTRKRNTCKLWDTIGFFQSAFVRAISTWLGVTDETINAGKRSRSTFNRRQLPFIIEYCKRELVYFEALMQRLWHCLKAIGIKLSRWDGSGAAAQSVLESKRVYAFKGSEELQDQYYLQARCAYAGGRFELIAPGDYQCKVYDYDINSAYPYAMTMLPSFTGLRECHKRRCKIGQYDLVKIRYDGDINALFHPYFHRHKDFNVSYPLVTTGWHWGIEYIASGRIGEIVAHLHWDDDGTRPLSWVRDFYKYRYELKEKGDKAELAVKLVINSLYGKFAQQRGWRPGMKRPRFHQLYWAGWITAYTRSMIYQAMMQEPDSVIAVETDGIFTTKPLKLKQGKELGDWGVTEFDNLTYVQSGMYFGELSEGHYDPAKPDSRIITKYRGLDPGQLTRDMVLDTWEAFQARTGPPRVEAYSTRFRTLGTSLKSDRMNHWRQWKREKKQLIVVPTGKRKHNPFCPAPWGRDSHHDTIAVQPQERLSSPYNVLWADTAARQELYDVIEEEWEYIVHEN